jgi:hypothetical protein
MKFKISHINISLLIILLLSCGENSALREKTYYFEEDNKLWVPDNDLHYQFIMQDTNGISESYMLDDDLYYFGKSWGGFLGITTDMSHTEYHYQSYSSTYGNRFSISLTAAWPPYGDELFISLNNVQFAYDLKLNYLSRVYSDYGNVSHLMTSEGYEETEQILSTVELLNDVNLDGMEYKDVLHFVFKDFKERHSELTVKDIYVAKNSGLVKFVLNNDISYHRTYNKNLTRM